MTKPCPEGEQPAHRPARPSRARGRWAMAQNGLVSPLLRRKSPDPAGRTVTLVGKPGCHLCDEAREVIVRVAGELGASFEEKDITQDEELYRRYWEQIR